VVSLGAVSRGLVNNLERVGKLGSDKITENVECFLPDLLPVLVNHLVEEGEVLGLAAEPVQGGFKLDEHTRDEDGQFVLYTS